MSNLKEMYLAGSSEKDREENDFYKTPEHATVKLLQKEKFIGSIWESACGDGAITKVLMNNGYNDIYSSDIVDRGFGDTGVDFLKTNNTKYNNIITNPPYGLAQQFVEKSLQVTDKKIAMLLKLNFLGGQKRYSFFKSTPLKSVYVFSKRLSFDKGDEKGKGNGLLEYAWYVWEHGYVGSPTLDWLGW